MATRAVTSAGTDDQTNASILLGSTRKTELTEALVTDWRPITASEQMVTVHWSATQGFYTLPDGTYSPLLFSESIRQAAAVLTHTAFEIPLTHRLGWEYIACSVDAAVLHSTRPDSTVELRMTHTAIRRRARGSVHLTTHVEATRDGLHLGTAQLRYSTHPPAIYNRLRGSYADAQQVFEQALPLTPALHPQTVGRTTEHDVVLSASLLPRQWRLRPNTTHRVLFDHAHDHVPGMVLLEAASQAAQACATPHPVVPVTFEATFLRYVELDQPCWISAETDARNTAGGHRIQIDAHQANQLAFSCVVTTQRATP